MARIRTRKSRLRSAKRKDESDSSSEQRRPWWVQLFFIALPLAIIVGSSILYGNQVGMDSLSAIKEWYQEVLPQTLNDTASNHTYTPSVLRTTQRRQEEKELQPEENEPPLKQEQEQPPKQEEPPKLEQPQEQPQEQKEQQKQEQPQQQHNPLNIVLFYADDWTMKVLGKLNPHVMTPNIDAMADQGVIFTNNCVTTSMCWISRASMMTGLYAARHMFLEPSSMNLFTTHPWNQTLFPLLKQAGYYTGLVGKWHAPQPREHMPNTFDFSNFYYGQHWMSRGGQTRHVTDCNREDALKFLQQRPKDKLFALKVSFFATHAWDGKYPSYQPQNSSKENWYNDVTIPTPKTATDQHWMELPHFFKSSNEGRNRWRRRWEPSYYQDNIKDLYRMVTEVDHVVGVVIEELKQQGVYNNTLLVFTTDNGNLHGEHGLAEKWYPWEESIRVPLVIQDPRMPQHVRGTMNDEWTLNIDLPSTLLGAAQIPSSPFMQGRDVADLYLGRPLDKPWRTDFFYEYNRGDPITAEGHNGKFWIDASFALITKEWKYIYWPQHQYEQLFHRSMDPYEEWDTLHNNATPATVQTTDQLYNEMKTRYALLKNWSQSGKPV